MKIGNIEFKNNIILAPMAGCTDVAFRSICVDFGASAGVTEMVSAKALKYDNEKTKDLLITAPNESVKIVQIFGHESDIMSEICGSDILNDFDIIDINMGCPAPKIVNNGDGSALMKNIPKAREIIEKCVASTSKPITVKFRSGFDEENINAIEFAKMCESAGASAITIHARTRNQMYGGHVDLDIVKKIKESVSIPVIASGDIVDLESYKHTINYTKCDGVMIGRGALGNPNIFSNILNENETTFDKLSTIKKHINLLRIYFSDRFIIGHIKKHILWYLKGEKNCSDVKVQVSYEPSLDKVIEILENFFKKRNN
ncbi:MAG: tRNA dihydrouridine synthase DusB [Clostridiales bacterium]|nr:tRNA dihydrouridine synthase DusB [Clostridiales bacterium]